MFASVPPKAKKKAQARELPVSRHLDELRHRLFMAALFVLPAMAAAFALSPKFLPLFLWPAHPFLGHLVALSPWEAAGSLLNFSLVIALVASSPVVFYQALAFILPGLTGKERRAVLTLLPAACGLFVVGAGFAFFVVVPYALRFLLDFTRWVGVTPVITLSSYLGFLTSLLLPFEFLFEFPLIVRLLVQIGIVTKRGMVRNRRLAILIAFIIAGALAPPDPVSMMVVAIPLVGLYEAGVWVAGWKSAAENRGVQ